MTNNIEALKKQLGDEAHELEMQLVRMKAALEEKHRLLSALNGLAEKASTSASNVSRRAKSITALGPHTYEYSGKQFSKPGGFLDRIGVHHYFSRINPGKDEAARQIVRWAKNNPMQAREVTVILADGTRINLFDAVSKL